MTARGAIFLLLLLGCAPRRTTPLAPLVLYNGGMEQGVDYPTRWGEPWVGIKQRMVHRDTQVKHQGAASLGITLSEGTGERAIGQELKVAGSRRLTWRGWVKTKGSVTATLALRAFRNGWEVLPYTSALRLTQESDWTPFEQAVTLPEETTRCEVGVLVKGRGQVWLDEVTLEGDQVQNQLAPSLWVAPPQHQKSTSAYPGFFWDNPDGWQFHHQAQKHHLSKTNPQVVLVGDSLTWGWTSGGQAEWERYFKPLRSELMAIGGDRTSQVLWCLQDGTLAGLHPKVIVLGIGINNLLRDNASEAEVVEGVLACRTALQKTCPSAKVLVVGLFPAKESARDPLRGRIRRVNVLLKAQLPDLLDFGNRFLEPDGTLSYDTAPDEIHFSTKGYALYRALLYPKIVQHLKDTRP